jgi:hypothetical protein
MGRIDSSGVLLEINYFLNRPGKTSDTAIFIICGKQ